MKKELLILLFGLFFTISGFSQSCDITFNPESADYIAGNTYSVILCFKDYTATGLPSDEKAAWSDYYVNYTAEGTTATWEALGMGNTFANSYCIKVTFVAGPVDAIKIGATATGNTHGCTQTESNTYVTVPIELASFDVKQKNDEAQLNWTTLSEMNFDYFTVEMSLNGKDFESVTDVKGAGESRDRQDYNFTMPLNEKLKKFPFLYFRLKQTDLDGTTTYSDVVTLTTKTDNLFDFGIDNAYCNNSNIHLDVTSFVSESLDVKIVGMNGQTLYNQKAQVHPGLNSIDLPLETGYSGMCIVQLKNNSKVVTKKVFVN